MNRWLVVAAPALALTLLPPACTGTESGNPRCLPADACKVDIELDGPALRTRDDIAVALDGGAVQPYLRVLECGHGADRGGLRWSPEDVSREADGSVSIRPADVSADNPSTVRIARQDWVVLAGELRLGPDHSVSALLTVVPEAADAGAEEPSVVRLEGELDVWCVTGEPGVDLVTGDGTMVSFPCHSTREPAPPCEDTGGGC